MNRDDFMDLSADLVDHSDQETSLSRFDENLGSLEISSVDLDNDVELFKTSAKQKKRRELEYKQLQHDLQLAKIELAQRDFQLNQLKLEYSNKNEILQEKVHELTHQNQILNTRLNSIISIHQEEEKQRQEQVKLELNRILIRQKELEENNERFMKNEREVKRELKNLDMLSWTTEEYEFMLRRDEDLLSIKEFAALKMFGMTRPLKLKLEEATKRIEQLENQVKADKLEMDRIKQISDEDRKNHSTNSLDFQKLYYELSDTKAQLQQANFKKDNYDKIKFEKDDLERKLSESEARSAKHLANLQAVTTERDNLLKDIGQLKQEISLLRQDKDYLHKQYVETQARCKVAEDKLEQTERSLDDVKRAKEDLYEKLMTSRDAYKLEYELKLNQELDNLKIKTNNEIEKLRTSTKEFYEREIQTMKEARDAAIQDRERHELTERELQLKCQEQANELRVVQVSCENKVSEMKAELKLKIFELERMRMLGDEHVNNQQKVILENEKLQKKLEVVQGEFYVMQMQNDKRFLELESELNEKKARLENYEKVENEMDSVIKQVAESSENGLINETEAEKLLLNYGYGTNVMMSARRKIQQNVHLTKRILQLEQLNTTLRHELNKERASQKDLQDQLEVAKSVIDNTKQPHEFLVRSIQSKELQLKKQQAAIDSMKKKIDELSTEKEVLSRKQNEMTADIEKLLRHNEELVQIKDELRRGGLSVGSGSGKKYSSDGLDIYPKPLMFTNRSNSPQKLGNRPQLRQTSPKRQVYAIDRS